MKIPASPILAMFIVVGATSCGSDSVSPVVFNTEEQGPADASSTMVDFQTPEPPTIEFSDECVIEGAVGRCSYGGIINGKCVALYDWLPERCNGIDDNCDGYNDHFPEGQSWEENWNREIAQLQAELDELGEPPIDDLNEFDAHCYSGTCVGPDGPVDIRAETPTSSRRYEVIQWMDNDAPPNGERLYCGSF